MIRIESDIVDAPDQYKGLTDIVRWRAVDEVGSVLARAGFASWGGRRWVFFDMEPATKLQRVAVLYAIRVRMRDMTEVLYSACDATKFATAERVNELLGFAPTGERWGHLGVWKWQK